MATRSFPITWSFLLTWKFIYEESTILTRFVCTPLTAVSLFCALIWRGGGEERVERFFFMWKQLLLFFIDPPTGEGYRPSSDSAVPYLLPTQPFFVLSRNVPRHCERTQKNSWLQNHRTWVKKGIWTIVFVGLSLVTYWNSLCPRLEKWKLCR